MNRRRFLRKAANTVVLAASANAVVYVVGTAFKEMDGQLTAGAKGCSPPGPAPFCPYMPGKKNLYCCPEPWGDVWYCMALNPC